MHIPRNLRHSQRPESATLAYDALVEFFSYSLAAAGVVRLLATRTKPVGYKHLLVALRLDRSLKVSHLPPVAIRAGLRITMAAGLVRLTEQGFSITDVGRDVQTCVEFRAKRSPSEAREQQTWRTSALRGRSPTSSGSAALSNHQSTFCTERSDCNVSSNRSDEKFCLAGSLAGGIRGAVVGPRFDLGQAGALSAAHRRGSGKARPTVPASGRLHGDEESRAD